MVHFELALLFSMYLAFQKAKIKKKKVCKFRHHWCLNCSLLNLHHVLSIFLFSDAMRVATPKRQSVLTCKSLLKVGLSAGSVALERGGGEEREMLTKCSQLVANRRQYLLYISPLFCLLHNFCHFVCLCKKKNPPPQTKQQKPH